jgi:monoamine oxidase
VTTTNPAAQASIQFTDFKETQLPQKKRTAAATQHFIASAKLFFPLKTKYWTEENNKIPQILITDTFVQDVYALDWDTKKDAGVLLASYTWEDDSLKLLPFEKDKLAEMVMSKLDEITIRTVGQKISEHIDADNPVLFHWITQPTYLGCSKLYRAYSEEDNYFDLSYNEKYAEESHLYFAGENYGVEGGWTEPALRSALDAVIQMNKHAGSTFVEGFDPYDMTVYPKWQKSFDTNQCEPTDDEPGYPQIGTPKKVPSPLVSMAVGALVVGYVG